MKNEPIFVIGCPRSGTTLLSQLLSSTQWGAPVETQFIIKYYKKLKKYGEIENKKNFKKLMRDILSERPIMQWKLTINLDQFYDELPIKNYRNIIDRLCMKRFNTKGKLSWGDKTPRYIIDLDILYKLFPNSKFIYIVRDGRDTALSLLNRQWGPNNIFSCAEFWERCNRETNTINTIKKNGQLFRIHYERLLENPNETVKKIYNFLGLNPSNNEITKITKNINPGNYNKWKTKMSKKQRKRFEAAAGDTLERLGYEREFQDIKISHLEKVIWHFLDRLMLLIHLVKINTIDTFRIKFLGMEPFAD